MHTQFADAKQLVVTDTTINRHVIELATTPEEEKRSIWRRICKQQIAVFATEPTIKADILHVAAHHMMILAADAVVPFPTRHVRSCSSSPDGSSEDCDLPGRLRAAGHAL